MQSSVYAVPKLSVIVGEVAPSTWKTNTARKSPAAGAILTVYLADSPLLPAARTKDAAVTSAGFIVNAAVVLVLLKLAVMVALETAATDAVVTVNVAELAFAGTVTLTGTVAAAVLLLPRATTLPPVGAVPFKVTVPVEFAVPPVTLVGFKVTEDTAVAVAGLIVIVALAVPL